DGQQRRSQPLECAYPCRSDNRLVLLDVGKQCCRDFRAGHIFARRQDGSSVNQRQCRVEEDGTVLQVTSGKIRRKNFFGRVSLHLPIVGQEDGVIAAGDAGTGGGV